MRQHVAAAIVLAIGLCGPTVARAQSEVFSYPVGLDPNGDNWVALRSLPSGSDGVRVARLGPDTLFTELGRQDGWVNVRLTNGLTGWISSRYVGCCKTAAAGPAEPPPAEPPRGGAASCDDLWYQRNAIFKAAGYCFRSARGIQTFGNEGCRFDREADVPLSPRQSNEVAQVRSAERGLGCTP